MSSQFATLHGGADNQRREGRAVWGVSHDMGPPDMLLRLAPSLDLPVIALRNVSNGGASVLVGREVVTGTMASIVLGRAGIRMAFTARLAWCRRADDSDMPLTSHEHAGSSDGLFAVGLHVMGPGSFATMVKQAWRID